MINYRNRYRCNFVHEAPGGAENTRWDTYRRQLCLREIIAIFLMVVS